MMILVAFAISSANENKRQTCPNCQMSKFIAAEMGWVIGKDQKNCRQDLDYTLKVTPISCRNDQFVSQTESQHCHVATHEIICWRAE